MSPDAELAVLDAAVAQVERLAKRRLTDDEWRKLLDGAEIGRLRALERWDRRRPFKRLLRALAFQAAVERAYEMRILEPWRRTNVSW